MTAPRTAQAAPRSAQAAPRSAQAAPRFARLAPRIVAFALGFAALAPAAVQAAAPDSDRPAGAAELVATTAENGVPTDLSALLDLRETGPDPGVPRCLGEASFARTAWAWIPAASETRRLVVSATAQSGSTQTPDLALFPQEPVTRDAADVREPAACDGRETFAGGARDDGSAAVVAVLRAGRPALVQVGWRDGDAEAPVVVALGADPLDRRARPAGDDPADAPAIALGAPSAIALGGATLGPGDPAQPACPAPATVWRRVAVPAAGVYAVTAGEAARTLTAFADPLGGDSALACSDLADSADLTLTPRVAAAGPLWIRIGADQLTGDPFTQLLVRGPFADEQAARDAAQQQQQQQQPAPGPAGPPARGGQPGGVAAPACIRARTPRLTIDAASVRALRRGSGRTLRGTVRQPCDRSRPRATHVTLALSSASAARTRRAGAARGVRLGVGGGARWTIRLPRRLAPGRHTLVVRALARGRAVRGARARPKPRVLSTVRRTLTVATPTPTRRAVRR